MPPTKGWHFAGYAVGRIDVDELEEEAAEGRETIQRVK